MSSSPPTRMIGVHKAPANLSREELEKKYRILANAFTSLPVVQKHGLTYEVCFANPTFDDQIRAINLAPSDATVIAIFETTSHEALMEILHLLFLERLLTNAELQIMTDPAFRKVMEGGDFLDRGIGGTFAVDVLSLILIDK
ncbi:hypothetical protein MVEN_01891000 [Mycena venus]|uniref:EthD domain-containing protein n=1 Tax=Mycena venus TaxID=2733690 RepID=A0A8H7CN94_9AGAR|nr:hypothetical protein MVEN_01891000 [Mycena venus]